MAEFEFGRKNLKRDMKSVVVLVNLPQLEEAMVPHLESVLQELLSLPGLSIRIIEMQFPFASPEELDESLDLLQEYKVEHMGSKGNRCMKGSGFLTLQSPAHAVVVCEVLNGLTWPVLAPLEPLSTIVLSKGGDEQVQKWGARLFRDYGKDSSRSCSGTSGTDVNTSPSSSPTSSSPPSLSTPFVTQTLPAPYSYPSDGGILSNTSSPSGSFDSKNEDTVAGMIKKKSSRNLHSRVRRIAQLKEGSSNVGKLGAKIVGEVESIRGTRRSRERLRKAQEQLRAEDEEAIMFKPRDQELVETSQWSRVASTEEQMVRLIAALQSLQMSVNGLSWSGGNSGPLSILSESAASSAHKAWRDVSDSYTKAFSSGDPSQILLAEDIHNQQVNRFFNTQ